MEVLSREILFPASPYENPIDNFSGEIKSQIKKKITPATIKEPSRAGIYRTIRQKSSIPNIYRYWGYKTK